MSIFVFAKRSRRGLKYASSSPSDSKLLPREGGRLASWILGRLEDSGERDDSGCGLLGVWTVWGGIVGCVNRGDGRDVGCLVDADSFAVLSGLIEVKTCEEEGAWS